MPFHRSVINGNRSVRCYDWMSWWTKRCGIDNYVRKCGGHFHVQMAPKWKCQSDWRSVHDKVFLTAIVYCVAVLAFTYNAFALWVDHLFRRDLQLNTYSTLNDMIIAAIYWNHFYFGFFMKLHPGPPHPLLPKAFKQLSAFLTVCFFWKRWNWFTIF